MAQIFIFSIGNNVYKYDTLTDTYTNLTSCPIQFGYGAIIAKDTDIYLFGSTNARVYAYKYNTLTDEYTRLTNMPYSFAYGTSTIKENVIYLFGGYTDKTSAYKYNTLTDEYTQLTNIPFNFENGGAATVDDNIYLFNNKNAYKYDILANEYIELKNIPDYFKGKSVVAFNNNIYLFGVGAANGNYDNNYVYLIIKAKDKEIMIKNTNIFNTKLTKNIDINFSEVKIYDDNKLKDYPAYWGDGEKWNRIA